MISVICGDNIGRVRYIIEKAIGDYPILLVETMAFREAILTTIRKRLSDVVVKSDSQIATRAIMRDIKVSSQIPTLLSSCQRS